MQLFPVDYINSYSNEPILIPSGIQVSSQDYLVNKFRLALKSGTAKGEKDQSQQLKFMIYLEQTVKNPPENVAIGIFRRPGQ